MAGIRRVKGDEVKQATPLLPGDLMRLFINMNKSRGSKAHVTASECSLLRKDLSFHPWGVLVSVRKSKTNQFWERVHKIPVAEVANRELCAA